MIKTFMHFEWAVNRYYRIDKLCYTVVTSRIFYSRNFKKNKLYQALLTNALFQAGQIWVGLGTPLFKTGHNIKEHILMSLGILFSVRENRIHSLQQGK